MTERERKKKRARDEETRENEREREEEKREKERGEIENLPHFLSVDIFEEKSNCLSLLNFFSSFFLGGRKMAFSLCPPQNVSLTELRKKAWVLFCQIPSLSTCFRQE